MATIITEAARSGYRAGQNDLGATNPYLASSPAWYGWAAGFTLAKQGRSEVTKATMGRGYSVNIDTAATRFVAKFGVALPPTIERKD